MTTVIRAASAADFLALVPRLIGYLPTRSGVLIPFQGNRTLGALRLDLPGELTPEERDSASATAIGMVCKVTHVDAVAVVVYTDEPLVPASPLPADAWVRALLAKADVCGLRISEALCVARDGWASYLSDGTLVHALAEIPYAHEAFADEPLPHDDQISGATLPSVDLAAKERVGRALADIEEAMESLFGTAPGPRRDEPRVAPGAFAAVCRMDDLPLLFEEALSGDPAHKDPYETAVLAWCLSRPGLRDVALVQWSKDLPAGDEAFDAQMRWADGEDYPEHLAQTMWGDGPSPDPERLQAALELTRHLAAAAPRAARPGILAATGWLAWAVGRSSHAGRYAEQALEIDPDHGMAELVLRMAGAGHLPEWVYRRTAPSDPVTRLVDSRGVESPAASG
ncbi:DUF4192 family protein [Microbacterium sp. RD1]|uniref:DUF4192 family protein n=1 Tax=Microbacterium sp. RD1 TaxID=3457313 RepID=UPI003FA5F2D3